MEIHRLIASGSYGPDEIKAMTAAYETALVEVGSVDRDDPLTELIANSVLTITATGERDPKKIKERALRALGTRVRDVASTRHPPRRSSQSQTH